MASYFGKLSAFIFILHLGFHLGFCRSLLEFQNLNATSSITFIKVSVIPAKIENDNGTCSKIPRLNLAPELHLNNRSLIDCGSPEASLTTYTISPCTTDPCVISRGTSVTLTVNFMAKVPATYLSCSVFAQKFHLKYPLGCGIDNICNVPGIVCPLVPGELYAFAWEYNIPWMVPPLEYYLQATIRDEQNRQFLCIGANVEIS